MRPKFLLLVCLCAAAFFAGSTLGSARTDAGAPSSALCSSGFVDAVIGGQQKCLHAGEFCAARYEADYERYGFACIDGRLQTAGAGPATTSTATTTTTVASTTTTTTASAAVYVPAARTKASSCRARGGLPDASCTPGAVFANVTATEICTPGYAASVRNVPTREKRAVYAEYGIASHRRGQYEVDHLVSLELGGTNAIANLWPEAASPSPGFHQKDAVENDLHRRVCSGAMSLVDAQRLIATDWLEALAHSGR